MAELIYSAGVFIGSDFDSVVFEDTEIGRGSDKDILDVATRRNKEHAIWAFKRPNIHTLNASLFKQLRNPLLILTFRDPIAIASRASLSEYIKFDLDLTHDVTLETLRLLSFARELVCPVLMISYEKAVLNPVNLAENVLAFCGLENLASSISERVEPSKPSYVSAARRRYHGHIDNVTDGWLRGWAADLGTPDPIEVELLVDEEVVACSVAGQFRQDLKDQGIGAGCHGFSFDVCRHAKQDPKMTVRVRGRTYELVGSGRNLSELLAGV